MYVAFDRIILLQESQYHAIALLRNRGLERENPLARDRTFVCWKFKNVALCISRAEKGPILVKS